MNYQNKFDINGCCNRRATNSWIELEKALKVNQITITQSSEHQDIYEHIDGFAKGNSQVYSFDIKGLSKNARNDNKYQNNLWIEIKNVNGDPGWIMGKADKIIFERTHFFISVDRKELFDYCIRTVNFKHEVSPKFAKYALYTRKNRKDVITLIDINDIMINCKSTKHIQKIK